MAGWSCAAGFIKDLNKNSLSDYSRGDIVDAFLDGASYSYGAVLGTPALGVGYNRVHQISFINQKTIFFWLIFTLQIS